VAATGTVIAALRHRDGVLIGADSQASDFNAQVRWPCTKLRRIGGQPFVAGFSGSLGSAERIFGALDGANLRPNQLQRKARLQTFLDGVVKPEYVAALARSPNPNAPIPIWGLAAGCVEAEPRILEFEPSGDSMWHEYFHAIGSGAPTAYAAFRTLGGRELCRLSEGTALLALLRIIRTSISVDFMGVSEPIRVFRVACNAASELSDDEVNTNLQAVDEWEQQERANLFAADGLTIEEPGAS
jgi:20S proteasome alpha/beta subunit